MNTPSHFLMTAALRRAWKHQPPPASAFLLGSVAPDIALYLLSLGGALHFRYLLGWSAEATWRHLFDTLYFHNPFWIAAHNLLHSPTVLIIALIILWRAQGLRGVPRRWLRWFLAACLLHSFVDVLTHVDDGPLLFFPFEWTIRFESPVSYWDSRHYGTQFAVFELTLDVLLIAYLCLPPLWRLARARLVRAPLSDN